MADAAAPARTLLVSGFVTGLTADIALDTSRDELWVSGYTGQEGNDLGRIVVVANVSATNGSVVPARDISGLPDFQTFAHDRVHDTLYLAGGGGMTHGVYVFDNASTLTSNPLVSRMIDVGSSAGTSTNHMTVDEQRDILYVPDPSAGLQIVRGASTATNTVATVMFPGTNGAINATVDSGHDRLYVAASNCAYVFDNASTLTSTSTVTQPALMGDGKIWSFAFP
jgi:hypothetical protein